MPVDSGPIAPSLRKPGDLRHPVTDRDQKLPTVSAAPQANTRDLAQWHVYHAAYSQLVLVRLSFSHGKGSLRTSSRYNHCLMISRVFCSKSIRVAMSALGQKRTSEHVQSMSALPPKADIRMSPVCVRRETNIPAELS